jgi:arginase family enzyme
MKPPSHFDGKPIGAPMDAKSPFHAGVTMGPDQIERMEELRRLRNRAWKAQEKERRHAMKSATTDAEREAYKQRRKRADQMTRALRNGKKVKAVADYYGITADQVLEDVKWIAANRNRNSRRDGRHRKRHPELPARRSHE